MVNKKPHILVTFLLSMEKDDFFEKNYKKSIDFFQKKSIILYVAADEMANARVAELADAHV